ncbi:S9 family peptidase [Streptomyces tsukubensis]|uniref:S9 family peptidase n=2 Tax=Streptomyces tsukubensis TaxID=83656 RepID=A0A1V4AHD9_9ACTN|nr:prolyl oligopeptidase family serine peptidase [Streptomyces tsukubensis]OON83031.1 S9 family peptidase [Streptomyces tsukubensis]
MVFTADAGGRCEIFAWDADTGRTRQVTDRPDGTLHGAIDSDAYVWWFDEDADGVGRWWHQPFDGGPRKPGLTGLPPGTPRGLAVGEDATVAVALGDTTGDTALYLGTRGGRARLVTRLPGHLTLSGIGPGSRLLALGAAAGSAQAVTLVGSDGQRHGVLSGQSGNLWCRGFRPGTDDEEVLLVQEAGDQYRLATWRPGHGIAPHPWTAFDTEITAGWYPDGRSVLVRQDRHGRSSLYRARLDTRVLEPLPVPPGSLLDAAARSGDDVHYLWTSTTCPPRLHSTAGTPLPRVSAPLPRVPGEQRDVWTPGPEGAVHTLLTLPEGGGAPPPVVFLVHGGPADHDRDAYDGVVHSLVASGFAAARVNYRGSTGYGPRWRAASAAGVGLSQVQDLAAVRADLIARGLVSPTATGLWGTSWGGYLVLLALGTTPGLWQAGVAVKPVADCAAAYRTTTPALRALDERLFGGTPDEVPLRYARSSPLTHVGEVRAPVLLVAATRDAKCPPGQVQSYLDALDAAGARHEYLWLDTGHDGYRGSDHVAVLRRAMVFLDRELRGPGRTRTTPSTSPSTRRGASGPVRTAAPAGTGTTQQAQERTHHAEGHHQQRPARG